MYLYFPDHFWDKCITPLYVSDTFWNKVSRHFVLHRASDPFGSKVSGHFMF